jgi:hypothetical protein
MIGRTWWIKDTEFGQGTGSDGINFL